MRDIMWRSIPILIALTLTGCKSCSDEYILDTARKQCQKVGGKLEFSKLGQHHLEYKCLQNHSDGSSDSSSLD